MTSIILVLSCYILCDSFDRAFIGLITPRELLSNYLSHPCIICLFGSAGFQPCEFEHSELYILLLVVELSILLSNIIQVLGTPRLDWRHCLALGILDKTVSCYMSSCHVLTCDSSITAKFYVICISLDMDVHMESWSSRGPSHKRYHTSLASISYAYTGKTLLLVWVESTRCLKDMKM